jgi:hypothetical protein
MYLDVGNIKKGYLIAPSFTTGATVAAEHVQKAHDKQIVLTPFTDVPITDAPTDAEREEFY